MEPAPALSMSSVPVPTKPWYLSSTIWLNTLTSAAEAVQMISGTNLLPPGAMLIASNVVNLLLRIFKTTSPLTFTGTPTARVEVPLHVARSLFASSGETHRV